MSLERVFEISTYFRAEKFHTTRHLNEFTSVDIEAAMMYKFDVMRVLENLVCEVTSGLEDNARKEFEELGVNPPEAKKPFPVITYQDALEAIRSKGLNLPFGEDISGEALRLLSTSYPGYYFIIDWPLSTKPFYIRPHSDNPELSESFDLMHGALELASGGQRIHEKNLLVERLKANNLNPEDFTDHLKFYDWGMPPHSGWGFGADRFVMLISGASNIREAVLYPRDPSRLKP
jgi:aspartyl-tRNA synthetase